MTRFVPVAALLLLIAPAALSGEPTPEDAYTYRHELFESLGAHMKSISMILKGQAGRPEDLVSHATAVAASAKVIATAFPAGSGKDVVARTRALPSVWEDPKGFQAAAEKLVQASSGLVEAAKGADQGAIKAAVGAVGQSCGGCHETYRGEKG